MAFLLRAKINFRFRYYKYFDGVKPIYGAKSQAPRLDKKTVELVEKQLSGLGFKDFERVDESA